jgi:hypothetical protein
MDNVRRVYSLFFVVLQSSQFSAICPLNLLVSSVTAGQRYYVLCSDDGTSSNVPPVQHRQGTVASRVTSRHLLFSPAPHKANPSTPYTSLHDPSYFPILTDSYFTAPNADLRHTAVIAVHTGRQPSPQIRVSPI